MTVTRNFSNFNRKLAQFNSRFAICFDFRFILTELNCPRRNYFWNGRPRMPSSSVRYVVPFILVLGRP